MSWEQAGQALGAAVTAGLLLLAGELGRRRYRRYRDTMRPGPDLEASLRPPPDSVPTRPGRRSRHDVPVEEARYPRSRLDVPLASIDVPFAESRRERCLRTPDCVLICGHEGSCYLTSWLRERERRRYWRRLRGEPEGD